MSKRATMTRQHFQIIADTICDFEFCRIPDLAGQEASATIARQAMADQFADALSETNGRFQRDRFRMACEARPVRF